MLICTQADVFKDDMSVVDDELGSVPHLGQTGWTKVNTKRSLSLSLKKRKDSSETTVFGDNKHDIESRGC